MDRRQVIALLGSTVVLPNRGHTQVPKKVYRVALVGGNGPADTFRQLSIAQSFLQGMRDLGYREGENVEYEFRSAEGKIAERSGQITEELIAKGVDVVVVAAPELAKEMRRHTTEVPIVMAAGRDLVALGVVSGLSRPGGNVTGFSIQVSAEIETKRLQLLKETAPTTHTCVYLGTKNELTLNGGALHLAAKSLDMTIHLVEHTLANHADAMRTLEAEQPDALIIGATTSLWVKRQTIYEFAGQQRRPVIYPFRGYVDAGGLMSYGVDLNDQWRRTADYVDKIIKGANPAEMPIQQPTKFDLVINLKAAKAIGLDIPAPVLSQAADVVE
jgi:ABC-type uncharacterized transport system substrate-binding protein